jgi:hypothetical protein
MHSIFKANITKKQSFFCDVRGSYNLLRKL